MIVICISAVPLAELPLADHCRQRPKIDEGGDLFFYQDLLSDCLQLMSLLRRSCTVFFLEQLTISTHENLEIPIISVASTGHRRIGAYSFISQE